jgi:hypothetical protein
MFDILPICIALLVFATPLSCAHVMVQLLRFGGSWGIESGRRGNPEILSFWEQPGCLISNPQAAVSSCTDTNRVMHESRVNGLATLLQAMFASIQQVRSLQLCCLH